MYYNKNQVLNPNTVTQAADTPQSPTPLTPQTVVEQLRTIRNQIAEVQPLTPDQKKTLQRLAKTMNNEILQASISVIGSSDVVQQSVGQAEDARALYDESNRWTEVEDELRTMLNGIAGANVIRRQRLALIASRAYGIGNQLARDEEHAMLKPQLAEIKRLKRLARPVKKATPQDPAPQPSTAAPAEKK
ncbi:MAG TPA: hypothetical protein VH087_05470 [Thermoanaerobaculia bacterium]|jgi:hypothetical protein|nr:hypothetical protein [Thermoanaerobaculia bacterium]